MTAALIIIDTQNDFCAPSGVCALSGGSDASWDSVHPHIDRVLAAARANRMEIVWVQYLGDDKYKTDNLRERDERRNRRPKCLENTWGVEFYRLCPENGEKVIQKFAFFDPFLNPEFERHLKSKAITNLVLAGLYLDVCIDSTARTGFQKGYYISILSDCTIAAHFDKEAALEFMKKYYGARILTSGNFADLFAHEGIGPGEGIGPLRQTDGTSP